MKSKVLKGIMLATILLSTGSHGFAQKSDSTQLKRGFQFTFFSPLGSNGVHSYKYSNNVSLNMLVGVHGGVRGAEFGGLSNYNTGNVYGFQAAGILNINQRQTNGFMASGIGNYAVDTVNGAQLSGIFNYAGGRLVGGQTSLVNVVNGELVGGQLGLVNYASKLKGIQLGLINISKEAKGGVPIGLISVVKNGHFELEVAAGDLLYANINYKMGVERFYNIFKVGYGNQNGKSIYAIGYGYGTIIPFSDRHGMNIDLTASALFNNDHFDNELENFRKNDATWLTKLDLNYRFAITPKLTAIAGPSLNFLVSEKNSDPVEGQPTDPDVEAPYSFWDKEVKGRDMSSWVGFNAGISYKF